MKLLGIWSCAIKVDLENLEETYRGAIICLVMTLILPNILPSFLCKLIGQLLSLPICAFILSLIAVGTKASMPYWFPVLLSLAYLRNASHFPNGSLYADPKKYGHDVASLSLFFSYVVVINTSSPPNVIMGASCVAMTLAILFAAVADVWYAVGTGQFQMVSVDTAGIVFYFFCPMYILLNRAMDRYDFSFSMENEYVIMSGIVVFALLQLNSLCPLAGYIHANAYTTGQPNRKRFAACFHYQSDHLQFYNQKETPILNLLVTQQDLETLEKETSSQKMLNKHELILCNCSNSVQLENAIELYTKVMGNPPKWYHASVANENITVLSEATMKHNINIAYWSNTVITSEVKDGTFFYCKEKLTVDQIQTHVATLKKSTPFKMETISTVAIPMSPMILS